MSNICKSAILAGWISAVSTSGEEPQPDLFHLQILHSSDNESAFQDPNTLEPKILHYSAITAGLQELAAREGWNTLHLTAGDHSLPGLFYEAAGQVESLGAPGLGDIAIYNALGLDANGMGNHEFDGGLDDFARMLNAAEYPFLSVNLDFAGAQVGAGVPEIEIGEDALNVTEVAGKVVRSAYAEIGGERVGLIGRSPADFFNVISDPSTTLPGVDFIGGRNPDNNQPLVSALGQVLEQVDLLKQKGINKIILLDHAQDFTGDPLSASALRDIDIIVAAGSTGFMGAEEPNGPFNLLREGEEANADYPTVREDSEGNTVLVVNSDQLYAYIGQLVVSFNADGLIESIDERSGPIATTEQAINALREYLEVDELDPISGVREVFEALSNTPLILEQLEVVGETKFPLNGGRAAVRSRETNLGRLAADSTLWFARRYAVEASLGIAVDIALKNGGGIRESILGPNITRLAVGEALRFNNQLAILELSGAELLAAMENAVSRIPSLDGRFPHVAGLDLEYDLAFEGISDQSVLLENSRVSHLVVHRQNGERVAIVENHRVVSRNLQERFVLATNNFLLTGGDGYRVFKVINDDPDREVFLPETGERQILSDYIRIALNGQVDLTDRLERLRVRPFLPVRLEGSYASGVFDDGGAEIVAYDPVTRRMFVSNARLNGVDVISLADPRHPELDFQVTDLGGIVNSVAVKNGIVALAVQNPDKVLNGHVVFLDALFGFELNRLEVGALPDMVTFSPDGTKVLTANEGEPNDDYTVDPEGSISVIDIGLGRFNDVVNLTQDQVQTIRFTPYNFLKEVLVDAGIRVFGEIKSAKSGNFLRYSTLAEDLEPEYIAVSPDSSKAYVTLQENNALAIVDLMSMALVNIVPLGYKDHSVAGNGFDASNRDGMINIQNWPVWGMYMPDTIATFETLGSTYLITANEGDSRDYDGYSEETRVASLTLDPEAYPNAEELQAPENLGRLLTTINQGDWDGDGDVDQIFSYGARSFTIWNEHGEIVWDSGDALERITAEHVPDHFNSTDNENGSFDERSDDKGPEPESVAIGEINGRIYAFIGLERVGGIVMYDVTYPYSPTFVNYINTRQFEVLFTGDEAGETPTEEELAQVGDMSPEGLIFISAEDSPTGRPALMASNEVSGNTTLYTVEVPLPKTFKLQVVHSSDNESSFQDPNTLEPKILNYATVVHGLRAVAARENMGSIHLTAGDHTLPGPFYEASAEAYGANGIADILFYNAMGLDANGMGNHEFDGGINDFAEMLFEANYPFIAVNLDFSAVELEESAPAIEIGEDAMNVKDVAGKVVRSAWVEVNGQRIGLIGRAPADFFNVIEDPENTLPGLDFFGGRDPENNQPLVSAVGMVMEQVEKLEARGVNKIILMDHAQDFTGDPLAASDLRGIDIIVSAGSTGFLAKEENDGPFNFLRAGDVSTGEYPSAVYDSQGNTVLVVNTDQQYSYVGNLMVEFDEAGHIIRVDDRSGPVATTEEAIAALAQTLGLPGLDTPQIVTDIFFDLSETDLIIDQFQVVGKTEFELNGLRANVRTRETNLGRLAADSTLWFAQEYVASEGLDMAVDIALKNGGGIRDTIQGPNIIKLTIAAALAFDNRLGIIELNAGELIATMENAISRAPSSDGRFPHVAGMFLEYDLNRVGVSDATYLETASRIRNLIVYRADGTEDVVVENFEVQGDLARTFGLATNSFLVSGGDGYQALKVVNDDPERGAITPEVGERQILAEYIKEVLDGEISIADPTDAPRVRRYIEGPQAAFDAWILTFLDAGSGALGMWDDADFDGVANFIEFLYATHPAEHSQEAILNVASTENGTELTFVRNADTGLNWTFEMADSVAGEFAEVFEGSDYSMTVTPLEGGREHVSLIFFGMEADARFLRVNVVQ